MPKTQSISVIVPAYNEEEKLHSSIEVINNYLNGIVGNNFEILIIENGSTDRTPQIAKNLTREYKNIKSFFLPKPSYGEAYRYGILQASSEMVTIYPVDLAFSLDFIGRAYKVIEKYPIILGVRFHKRSIVERNLIRVIISRVHTILVNIFFNTEYNDVDCLKAFRTNIGKELVKRTTANGPFIEVELAYLIDKRGISYYEIPVNHIEKSIARHPIYIIRSIIKNFIELLKYRIMKI